MADHPERCETCRFFWRHERVQQLADQHPERGYHGVCRKYAPGAPNSASIPEPPLVVHHPPGTFEDGRDAQEIAQQLAEGVGHGGRVVLLPAPQWEVSFLGNRSISPNGWCGEWEAAPGTTAKVYADFLEEAGCPQEWVDKLRGLQR